DSKQLLVTAHTKDTSQMNLGRDFGAFLVDASGKQPPKLLGELYADALNNYGHCPILSPDGTQAIMTEPQGYSAKLIDIADEIAISRALPGRCHSFAPDGKRLAAINISRSLILIDRTTLEVSELLNWQGTSALADNTSPCPAWSPDGKQIAFIRSPDSTQYNDELYIVNVADGVQRQLSDAAGVVFDFDWSPDGKTLSYKMGGNAETSGFFVIPVSGGDAFKLTEGLTGLGMMVWAPIKKN
ncbi:MAG: PD40 domain-containing protein, partial [Caldilineaceae bacterium]|nr:PD40 domain-containing protein [Caldilineaceae bacterium]